MPDETEIQEAIADLDTIPEGDPERAHSEADKILLKMVPPEVRAAYERLTERCSWWAAA